MLAEIIDLFLSPIERALRKRRGKPDDIKRFYRTVEWKRARYDALTRNPRCAICGASAKSGARMNVDHIKPLSKRWDLRLARRNLQTTCASCNWGQRRTLRGSALTGFGAPAKQQATAAFSVNRQRGVMEAEGLKFVTGGRISVTLEKRAGV